MNSGEWRQNLAGNPYGMHWAGRLPEDDLVIAREPRYPLDEQPAWRITHLPTGLCAIGPGGVSPDQSMHLARAMLAAGLNELGEL